LYWLTFNICSVAPQFSLLRRYPRTPLAPVQALKSGADDATRPALKKASPANSPAARKKRAR
jgi:hypothetical protein